MGTTTPHGRTWPALRDALENYSYADLWALGHDLFAASETGAGSVWCVENRTSRLLFASKELALAYLSSFPASVGGGLAISEIPVTGGTTPSSATPAKCQRCDYPNCFCKDVPPSTAGGKQ
jgi:hypothetical protein